MKVIFSILTFLLLTYLPVHAQETIKYWNVLQKISNNKADFFVSNPVRFKDSTGQLVSIKNIVILENSYLNKIAKKYGEQVLPQLVSMLNDSTRDWAANLLLYNITTADAVILKYYSSSKINEWRSYRKQDDIIKWKEYLKKYN